MAWDLFADPVGARFVNAYLHHDRGIDVKALETANGGPLAGRAGSGWTRLVDQLIRRGVTPEELRAVDLAQFTRHGSLIDTLRDRVVLPIRIRDGRIAGFIGRDVSGDPRAPKYRNPAHTPVFDKSLTLYRPILVARHPEATVVVVEGPLDAPAIAATAADAGLTDRVIPVSANGTAVSGPQAAQVCALAPAGIVLALDGDDAGRAGTERWLDALTFNATAFHVWPPCPIGSTLLAGWPSAAAPALPPSAPMPKPTTQPAPGLVCRDASSSVPACHARVTQSVTPPTTAMPGRR